MFTGIYIHLPYCVTKCPYCDFNSYGTEGIFPEKEYMDAVIKELNMYGDFLRNAQVDTIFFGGGTPSLFTSKSIEQIIFEISTLAKVSNYAEISLELNPKTVDKNKLIEFKEVGINRLSVGVQSFTSRKLDFYGRINKPVDSENVLIWIKDAGFTNFNIDLIYGSADETIFELEFDLKEALRFEPAHISAYCLTIEDGTEFGRLYKSGKLKLPTDKRLGEFMDHTSQVLESAGYNNYEISNFSKPGFECKHNLVYWRSNNYLGIGAGAHSHISTDSEYKWGVRWFNYRSPDKYISINNNSESPVCKKNGLSKIESLEDKVLMGLRLKKGISVSELEKKYHLDFEKEKIKYLFEDEFIIISDGYISLSKKGMLFANEIITRVLGAFH